MTQHIRRPTRRRGGNQWYRDRSTAVVATYCGGEATTRDVGKRDAHISRRAGWPVCEACWEAMQSEK